MGHNCSKGLTGRTEIKKKGRRISNHDKRRKRHKQHSDSELDIETPNTNYTPKDTSIIPTPIAVEDIGLNDNEFNKIFEVSDSEAFNEHFIEQRLKVIKNTSYRSMIETWQPNSLQQLARFMKDLSAGKSIIDRHWIIFYWITYNIEYDTVSYFAKDYKDQTAQGVFQNRKGVCAGYANLYKYLCDQLKIPCEIVSGYAKGYGFENRTSATREIDHAWNAVKIYNHWYLMESTWGAGNLNDKKEFQRKLCTYYFLPRPDEMIYHHLPEDEKWQLLKTPIKMAQYLEMPQLRPNYFELKLEMIQPFYKYYIDFEHDKPYALAIIKTPPQVTLLADLKLDDEVIEYSTQVIFNSKHRHYYCYFAPPNIGKYKAMIYGSHTSKNTDTHECILDFEFNVKTMPENPISYPKFWRNFYKYRIKILSPLNTHLVNVSHDKKYGEIILRTPTDIELIGALTDQNENETMGGEQIYYDREKNCWKCQFAPNKNGLFTAVIHAKKKSDTGNYTSAVQFQIKAYKLSPPFISFPKTWSHFYNLGLKILSPTGTGIFVLDEKTSYATVRIKAPANVDLLSQLQNDRNEEIPHAAEIHYDEANDCWAGKFATNQTGLFQAIILAKKKSDSGLYLSAVSFKLDVKKLPSKSVYVLDTTQLFYDLHLEVLPPYNHNRIVLSKKLNFVEILLKAPPDVDLLGHLKDSDQEKLPYAHQIYYDRYEDVWHCKFAPNNKGIFNAVIMAKKTSDSDLYSAAVKFPIEVNHMPSPLLTFPTTWRLFFDYDLEIISPRSCETPKRLDKLSYAEVLIRAPDHILLSSNMIYNDTVVENGSLAQYDHKRQVWQLLFAPERTGLHQLTVFAKSLTEKDNSTSSVAMFPLDVTTIRKQIKFPSTYKQFQSAKCQIYTPLNGILEKNSVVTIHCCIPDATSIMVTAGPKTIRGTGYTDPIFQRAITADSDDITIHAKYGKNPHYTTLIKYTVE